jgi:hypothetical protein
MLIVLERRRSSRTPRRDRSERREQSNTAELASCDWARTPVALESGEGNGRSVLLGFLLIPASTGSIAVGVNVDHRLEGFGVVRS